jgi:hypothetical protein
VLDHLGHRRPVADDQPRKIPLAFEDAAQQEGIAAGWHAVQVVEAGHQAQHAGLHAGAKWRQIQVPEQRLGDPGRVVLFA